MTIVDVVAHSVTLPPEGEVGVVDIGSLTLENGRVVDDVSIAVARGLLETMNEPLEEKMKAVARHFVIWADSDENNRAPGETCMRGCTNLARKSLMALGSSLTWFRPSN